MWPKITKGVWFYTNTLVLKNENINALLPVFKVHNSIITGGVDNVNLR